MGKVNESGIILQDYIDNTVTALIDETDMGYRIAINNTYVSLIATITKEEGLRLNSLLNTELDESTGMGGRFRVTEPGQKLFVKCTSESVSLTIRKIDTVVRVTLGGKEFKQIKDCIK